MSCEQAELLWRLRVKHWKTVFLYPSFMDCELKYKHITLTLAAV